MKIKLLFVKSFSIDHGSSNSTNDSQIMTKTFIVNIRHFARPQVAPRVNVVGVYKLCYPDGLQTDLIACRVTQGFCSFLGHSGRHSDGRDAPWLSANNVGHSIRPSSLEEMIQDKLRNLSGFPTPEVTLIQTCQHHHI